MIPDCDQAVVGLTQDHRPVYDYDRLVECFRKNNDWTMEMAVEWVDYNVLNCFETLGYPIVMTRFDDDD